VWGWLPGRLILLRLLNGSGPAGGAASAEGRAAGRVSWVCSRGCGWLVRVGIGDTLSAACVWWWWVPSCVLVCVWGWHAVGVLGQCALGCPACLGLLVARGFWVGVGGLVVNCIVDASILL